MNDQEHENNSKDKDYGFPFVAVTPLHAKHVKQIHVAELEEMREPKKETTTITEVNKPVELVSGHQEVEEKIADSYIKKEKIPKRKSNQLPVLISLVLLIVILLGAMAYFLYYLPSQQDIPTDIVAEERIEESEGEIVGEQSETNDELLSDQLESEAGQPEEVIADSNQQQIVQTPPVKAIGELKFLSERGNPPQYYIIVGSLPNERIARAEAAKILDQGEDLWLIPPFGNTRNYRLSVGGYATLPTATDAMEKSKAIYGESIWILKY